MSTGELLKLPNVNDIATAYDAVANSDPDACCYSVPKETFECEWLDKFVDKFIAETPILDIGCGAGAISAHFETKGVRTIGIDLSMEMVSLARRHHPKHAFYTMNAQSLRFPNNSFGGAIAYFSLMHLSHKQLEHTLDEVLRILIPKAPILMALSAASNNPSNRLIAPPCFSAESLPLMHYSPEDIQELFDRKEQLSNIDIVTKPASQGEQTPCLFISAQKL